MELISIITPVYNKEKYISHAIESVLNQSYSDFEYIIVDDGSTDASATIVDEYAKRDKRIRVIHQKNQWIYASFNNGIREATGKYIYILNADDKLRAGALELIAKKAIEYEPDVIWTKVLSHKADTNQNIIEYDYAHLDEKVLEDSYQNCREEIRKKWLFLSQSLLNLNQANLYKRDLMLKHPFRNDVYGADTLFNVSIADDINSSYILSTPVYDFFEYINLENASTGKYYDYEHRMFNELYIEQRKLVEKWNLQKDDYYIYVMRRRLISFSTELNNYLFCRTLNADEKICKILNDANDEIMTEVANNLNALPELERRLLFGINKIIELDGMDDVSKYNFLKKLLNLMEVQKEVIEEARSIVDDENNLFHIGKCFQTILREDEITRYIKYYNKDF